MASNRPSNGLPRRALPRRAVSSSSSTAGPSAPSTSTPAASHLTRHAHLLPLVTGGEAPGVMRSPSFGSPARSGSASPAVSLLDLDQHNNSSLTLSPRTHPKQRKQHPRLRAASGSQSRERSSLGLGELSGLPLPGTSRNGAGRRVVSTPQGLTNGLPPHTRSALDNTTIASNSSTSTSGILGANGSILERSSSPGIEDLSGAQSPRDDLDNGELSDASSTSTSASWTLIDRMRIWRNDALNQHLYSTAIFWGSKAFTRTRDPHDGFWLAQAYFAAGMYSRAERVLTGAWELPIQGNGVSNEDEQHTRRMDKGKGRQDAGGDADMPVDEASEAEPRSESDLRSSTTTRARAHQVTFAESHTSTIQPKPNVPGYLGTDDNQTPAVKTIRLTDLSVACRYLAAQAMVRQEKWSAAMELLGEVNPFKSLRAKARMNGAATTASRESGDGGIKFEASMCHLRGMVQLHLNAADRAKECFLEALSIDVKCYESFEALIGGNMMDVQEEWNFVHGLAFREHTPEDADFIRMMYTVRLKKLAHREEMERCGRALAEEYGLADDPDVLFGLADELYSAMRYADCYAVTSKILKIHDAHAATLPLHLACMQHLPHLRSKLFLLAHELVDREPESSTSWYAVGLWYFSGKRWEEARRYLGKALLIDNRLGPAWLAFAHSFALEGEHDQAITAYSTAQRHFQGTHLPLMFIGMQYIFLSNIKAADEYLDAAYAMCQTDPLLLSERGVAAFYNERFDDAVALFTSALRYAESVQSSPAAWGSTHLNLGQAHRKLGQHEKAIAAFKRVLELDAGNANAYSSLGVSLMHNERKEEAIIAFHEALALQPGEPTTTALLRMALYDTLEERPGKGASMNFPLLSDVIADEMDARIAEEEMALYDRPMRNGVPIGQEDDGGDTGDELGIGPRHTRGTRMTRAGRRRQLRNEQDGADDEYIPEVVASSASSVSLAVPPRPPTSASIGRDSSSLGHSRYIIPEHEGHEENENEDSTEDSAMIEASQESDMID